MLKHKNTRRPQVPSDHNRLILSLPTYLAKFCTIHIPISPFTKTLLDAFSLFPSSGLLLPQHRALLAQVVQGLGGVPRHGTLLASSRFEENHQGFWGWKMFAKLPHLRCYVARPRNVGVSREAADTSSSASTLLGSLPGSGDGLMFLDQRKTAWKVCVGLEWVRNDY